MRRIAALALLSALAGCATLNRSSAPTLREQWMATLANARVAADSGKYDVADRTLVAFAAAHPGTREAREIAFWRALYMMDPNNKNGSLAGGVTGMDMYLADDSTSWYKSEAVVLRRTAAAAQAIKLAAMTAAQPTTTPATTTPPPADALKTKDDEIASLRDQLAKVNAELDRIKKRLANPKG